MQLRPPNDSDPPSASNDFHQRVLIVPEYLGEGRWNVQARLALEASDSSMGWMPEDRIELRLYRNGVFQGVLATQVVTEEMLEEMANADEQVVDAAGGIDILAKGGDYLQVRIFLDPFDPANNRMFSARLTIEPGRNWVLFYNETP